MINAPTFVENTLRAVIMREECESRGMTRRTIYRYMLWEIEGSATLNYDAALLHYYFGDDWQQQITETTLSDMVSDDLSEMDTLNNIPMRFVNCHGVPDEVELEKPCNIKVKIEKIVEMDLADGITVKFNIAEVDSK